MDYRLYGSARSRTFRVLWMLEELGVPYDHRPSAPRSDDIRAVNPTGKVPVLGVEGGLIRDSSAILTFLADRHGRFTAPAGSVERGQQDALTFRVLDELEAPLWFATRHTFVMPDPDRIPDVKAGCRADFARAVEALFEEVEGPFLMGEEMTVPDFILGHCGGWAHLANFPEPAPAFADYLDRLRERPAFQRALG
ncbi:glutathione S-transferase family protein [Sagittula salina]|uniref:Glutathione S-transferase family protein n=1 Tax=Sagittula salina TaxID=2820268 RepID=A0A940S4C9_9RHOB|nr:glutathione S-transferase family protein [Sagittula salina]MBP0483740.1 glutathione S-transferase family protein [Sagittula salina]